MNEINVLILSDSEDFTTDYISIELKKNNTKYLRLDRDIINSFSIEWDLELNRLLVSNDGNTFLISENSLKSVYFRAPTYFRETFRKRLSPDLQLKNSQWLSFYRNLQGLTQVKWINSPTATYYAENKAIQLITAKRIGFNIPKTLVTNGNESKITSNFLIAKSLDTALFDYGDMEAFAYANKVADSELSNYDNTIAPFILQEYLSNKIDLRVTVVGNTLFACEILENASGIDGDWRLRKNMVEFTPVNLPKDISEKCISIVKSFNLYFAGIDLIKNDKGYFFVELNPTGEWAWLVDTCGFNIPKTIYKLLTS